MENKLRLNAEGEGVADNTADNSQKGNGNSGKSKSKGKGKGWVYR